MAEVKLTITLDSVTGGLSVTGPIHDKVVAYGLLEAAKEVIRENAAKKSTIVPVRGVLGHNGEAQ